MLCYRATSYKHLLFVSIVAWSFAACKQNSSGFVRLDSDRTVSGASAYPLAVDPSRVRTYPPDTKSGAGYFYDGVLEYRPWVHPDRSGLPINGSHDYFVALAQYERAEGYSKRTEGAENPTALVRQIESIHEPEPHQYVHVKEERITEWQV
jgi:hypothetical protein